MFPQRFVEEEEGEEEEIVRVPRAEWEGLLESHHRLQGQLERVYRDQRRMASELGHFCSDLREVQEEMGIYPRRPVSSPGASEVGGGSG